MNQGMHQQGGMGMNQQMMPGMGPGMGMNPQMMQGFQPPPGRLSFQPPRPESGIQEPETRNQEPEIRNPKSGTRNPKPGARDPKPKIRNMAPEIRNPKSQNPESRTWRPTHPWALNPKTADRKPETNLDAGIPKTYNP